MTHSMPHVACNEGTGPTANLFVLSVAKSQALNSRFAKGVERQPHRDTRAELEKSPKALPPAKLNQMRKPQNKKKYRRPTRNVCGPFFSYAYPAVRSSFGLWAAEQAAYPFA